MFRERGRGQLRQAAAATSRSTRRCSIWLSGIDNNKYAPNENYGRELMELFTLGVSDDSGYPYSEDDVREQARALTGWRADWDDDVGFVNFRFDPELHDKGHEDDLRQEGQLRLAGLAARSASSTRPTPRYFVDRLWSYFIPVAGAEDDALEADLDVPQGPTRSAPSSRRSWPTRSSTRARRWSSRRSSRSPACCAPAGAAIDTDSWSWLSGAGRAAAVPAAERGRLGRDPLARHLDLPRPLGLRSTRSPATTRRPRRATPTTRTPDEAVDKALRYWGDPTITHTTRDKLARVRQRGRGRDRRRLAGSAYRGLRQNALRMLVATSPDLQTC